MKYVKITLLILGPLTAAAAAAALLYSISGNFTGLYSHDVLEAHTRAALIPFICAVSFFAVFLPALVYTAGILYPAPAALQETTTSAAADMLQAPAPAALQIGQVIHTAGAQFRVKALKNTTFAAADLTQYEYLLNFSL